MTLPKSGKTQKKPFTKRQNEPKSTYEPVTTTGFFVSAFPKHDVFLEVSIFNVIHNMSYLTYGMAFS